MTGKDIRRKHSRRVPITGRWRHYGAAEGLSLGTVVYRHWAVAYNPRMQQHHRGEVARQSDVEVVACAGKEGLYVDDII